jgi:ubiquinone/menaquinone biosynthesis C-methylase UbiE
MPSSLRYRSKRSTVHAARPAYDLAAPFYDSWLWQQFWRKNERPIVSRLVGEFKTQQQGPRMALDLGAGTGNYLASLDKDLGRDWLICGIDLSFGMLAVANRRRGRRFPLVQADILRLPVADGATGLVLMARVASHVADLDAAAQEMSRVLSPGCHAIVSDIDPAHEYVATELPIADGQRVLVDTVKHSVNEWRDTAERHGMSIVSAETISAATAKWLPAAGFRSVDRGSAKPIAFVLGFRKK